MNKLKNTFLFFEALYRKELSVLGVLSNKLEVKENKDTSDKSSKLAE